jgi:hypothetical protein
MLRTVSLLMVALSMTGSAVAQSSCEADLDHDGLVTGADLTLVLGDWGVCKGCVGDLTGDGSVDGVDLAIVLARWGGECRLPSWATLLADAPAADVVFDSELRSAIVDSGLPWRVADTTTGIEMLLVPAGSFLM